MYTELITNGKSSLEGGSIIFFGLFQKKSISLHQFNMTARPLSIIAVIYSIQSYLCRKATLKRPKIGFQDQLLLNASQKYCRMLLGEHSAILSTFIKLPFVIKIFVLSIFECVTQVLLYMKSPKRFCIQGIFS